MPWIDLPERRPGLTVKALASDREWYRIRNADSEEEAELLIFDEIGWYGILPQDVIDELKGVTAPKLRVRVNSPGGSVFDGIALANVLRAHPAEVTVQVDGIAASIASVIAMAGDRIVMMPHSQMMIHDAFALAVGNAADMREMAGFLDKQSDNIAAVYAERAGGTVTDWRTRMLAESWYTADEAVAAGLADEVAQLPRRGRGQDDEPVEEPAEQEMTVAARWDLSIFRYAGRDKAPGPQPVNVARTPAPEPKNTAVGPHDTATKEGTWDAGAEQKKLPSPMPLATVRKMYALFDGDRVEDGEIPKDACSLPHHFVSEDGTPGAASLAGVRNALARLGQTQGYSAEEKETAERHLRGHLPDSEEDHAGDAPAAELDDEARLAQVRALADDLDDEETAARIRDALEPPTADPPEPEPEPAAAPDDPAPAAPAPPTPPEPPAPAAADDATYDEWAAGVLATIGQSSEEDEFTRKWREL